MCEREIQRERERERCERDGEKERKRKRQSERSNELMARSAILPFKLGACITLFHRTF